MDATLGGCRVFMDLTPNLGLRNVKIDFRQQSVTPPKNSDIEADFANLLGIFGPTAVAEHTSIPTFRVHAFLGFVGFKVGALTRTNGHTQAIVKLFGD